MEIVIVIRGQLLELLVEIAPDIDAPVVNIDKKRNAMIYVYLLKALYALIEPAVMFYLKIIKNSKKRFKTNPYGPRVVNKEVNYIPC